MKIYQSKYNQLAGTSHTTALRAARYEYHRIQKRTPRRQAYVKSSYFKNSKVFINQFWEHLKQKRPGDQVRRAKLFLCAVDLIRNTKEGLYFCVQVRESKRTGRKDFMSVFPKNARK